MTKTLNLLLVEDGKENMQNAKIAYQPFIDSGLLKVSFQETYRGAVAEIDKADALISDLYFPGKDGEKIINGYLKKNPITADKDIGNYETEEFQVDTQYLMENNCLPLGFDLAKQFLENKKPALIISNAFCGHGKGRNNSNWSGISGLGNRIAKDAFEPNKNYADYGSFITTALLHPYVEDNTVIEVARGKKTIIKQEAAYLTALKAVSKVIGKNELYDKIKLPKMYADPMWKDNLESIDSEDEATFQLNEWGDEMQNKFFGGKSK